MYNEHKPCIGSFYKSIVYTCMTPDFFYLFFPSIDGVKLGKGPDVPWGIFFAQATVGSLLGNFMTSPGSATAAAGPPQR